MKRIKPFSLVIGFVFLIALGFLLVAQLSQSVYGQTNISSQAEAKVGQAAPQFTLKDAKGKSISLANYKGKYVVLEWFNQGCPFVKKHYESGNMQKLQKEYTGKGVICFQYALPLQAGKVMKMLQITAEF